MAIGLVATPVLQFNANSTSVPLPTWAAGIAADELLVACVRVNSGGGLFSNTAGYTQIGFVSGAGSMAVLAKVAVGTEGGTTDTLTLSTGALQAVGTLRLTGVDLADWLAATEQNVAASAAASWVVPAITTDTNNAYVIWFSGMNLAANQGFSIGTEQIDLTSTNRGLAIASMVQAVAGSTGSNTITPASGTANATAVGLAFKPGAPPTVDGDLPPNAEISRINLTGALSIVQGDPVSSTSVLTGPRSN